MNGDDDATPVQSSLSANTVIHPAVNTDAPDSTTATQASPAISDSSLPDLAIHSTPVATEQNGHIRHLGDDLALRESKVQAGGPVTVVLESGDGEGTEPSPDTATTRDTAGSDAEGQGWVPDGDHELKRVKVSIRYDMFLSFTFAPNPA
jgi:hypothetical protein